MKVIKLDKRYTMSNFGFTHAIQFDEYKSAVGKIARFLSSKYGPEPYTHLQKIHHPWTCDSKYINKKLRCRIFVKNETVITLALLSVDLTNP